jgi:hypothetical protein
MDHRPKAGGLEGEPSQMKANSQRFEPPPVLHATPPLIIKIRRAAVPHHLAALQRLETLKTILPFHLLLHRMTTLVIPEVIYLSDNQEVPPSEELAVLCAQTLLTWQAETRRPEIAENLDPFSIPEEEDGMGSLETVSNLLQQSPWREAFLEALRQMVRRGSTVLTIVCLDITQPAFWSFQNLARKWFSWFRDTEPDGYRTPLEGVSIACLADLSDWHSLPLQNSKVPRIF